jgi:hypothetical protein
MSDSAEEIVKRMQHVRRDVGDDVKGIVETARTLSDWRYHVKHHPWLCVGLALALGFLVVPKRKRIPSAEAKELISLLKKYNVGVTTPPASAGGLLRTVISLAAPAVARTAMTIAQNRFAAMSSGHAAQSQRESAEYNDSNVPR